MRSRQRRDRKLTADVPFETKYFQISQSCPHRLSDLRQTFSVATNLSFFLTDTCLCVYLINVETALHTRRVYDLHWGNGNSSCTKVRDDPAATPIATLIHLLDLKRVASSAHSAVGDFPPYIFFFSPSA